MVAIDGFSIQVARHTLVTICFDIGTFDGQSDYQVAQVLLGSTIVCLEWVLAYCQAYTAINAVLIFKPHWLDLEDEVVLTTTRISVVAYTLISQCLDQSVTKHAKALEYMTGINEETTLGLGWGTLSQLSLLVATLTLLQIFKPTEMAQKGRLFVKLIVSALVCWASVYFVINMNENGQSDDQSKEDFSFLAAYVAGELFIGLVLPIVFVSSYPSLNERFGGTVLASL